MKKQIKRLSPHQNGKVLGILFALGTLPIVIPMFLAMSLSPPMVDAYGNSVSVPYFILMLFPLFYLVFGYISVVVGSVVYNFMFNYIGGLELEMTDEDA